VDLNADKGSSDSLIESMVDLRNQMRKKKDFHSADLIREKLREGGVYIEDRGDSTIWWKE
jgi:Cysteinyl-tRNA synthetase